MRARIGSWWSIQSRAAKIRWSAAAFVGLLIIAGIGAQKPQPVNGAAGALATGSPSIPPAGGSSASSPLSASPSATPTQVPPSQDPTISVMPMTEIIGYGASSQVWDSFHIADTRFAPGAVYDPTPGLGPDEEHNDNRLLVPRHDPPLEVRP